MSDGITVSGGAGGVRAQLSELAELAATLRAAVEALEAAHGARSRLAIATGARTASVLAPLDGRHGLRACAHTASALSRRLGVVRATYADADAQAAARMRGATLGLGHALGEGGLLGLGLVVAVGSVAAAQLAVLRLHRRLPTPLGAVLRWLGGPSVASRHDAAGAIGRLFAGESVLPRMPVVDRATTDAVVAGVGAWVQAIPPGRQALRGDPVPSSARALVAHATKGRSSRLLVIPDLAARAAAVPRTEADVLAVVADQYPGRGEPDRIDDARVAVERLDHADGSRSWVVAIPGTETWSANGPNPLDGLTDLQLIARTPDDVSALVARAMDQAGIGPGDAVLLAGHSLGGIVATSMAADPAITSRYRIAAVITAGAPVSGESVPAGTGALHLEHAQDSVPGLRGLPNPDELNRTTVVRDLSVSDDPAERAIRALGDAHSARLYVRTAELLPDADPSVIGFRSSLAEVLGPDVVGASTRTYAGVRVPLDGCTP
jgi:hypothetical protein